MLRYGPAAVRRVQGIMLQTTPTDPAALARRPDPAGPLAVATPTTRKLADASISVNTRRAYLGALARRDAWLGPAPLTAYLGAIFEAGRQAPHGRPGPTPRRTAGADSTP